MRTAPLLRRLLILAFLGALTYVNAMNGGFYLDDQSRLFNNTGIRTVFPLHRHFVDPKTMADVKELVGFRPLMPLTYSLEYAVWGLQPAGYRTTNLLILLATSGILALIAL